MTKPILGVPYHPRFINDAFEQTIKSLGVYFEIKKLNCLESQSIGLKNSVQKHSTEIGGLLLPGGHYGPDFKLFGSSEQDNHCDLEFKKSMFQAALLRGMPVLGLCAGMSIMNHVLGGSTELLTKNSSKKAVNHDVDPREGALAHSITIKPNTHLHNIILGKNADKNKLTINVNSWHHGGIKKDLAKPLIASAEADDEVVEAVELPFPNNPNCFGLQFHPEYLDSKKTPVEYEQQRKILRSFQQACMQYQRKCVLNLEIDPHGRRARL